MADVLTLSEKEVAQGQHGEGQAIAMRVLAETARLMGAKKLLPITSSHIDGCLYHGDSGVLFAQKLVKAGAQVTVPTSLNVGSLDLTNPDTVRLSGRVREMAGQLMSAHIDLGCQPTWTCAPYQAGHTPQLGQDVAWGESNAVAYCNSVLGARTNRYGDFLDLCCAITGKAPAFGYHLSENRKATILVDLSNVSPVLLAQDVFYPVLGAWYGSMLGDAVGIIRGIPKTVSQDQLKALGAASASAGAITLFHVEGITPEAPDLMTATQGQSVELVLKPSMDDFRRARDVLSTAAGGRLDAIALGSPHFSVSEFHQLQHFLNNRKVKVPFYVCTGRHTLTQIEEDGCYRQLVAAGITIIVDTCVVVTPILKQIDGTLMTNSGKFAWYSPSNTGYATIYGSLQDCVESAVAEQVVRDETLWM